RARRGWTRASGYLLQRCVTQWPSTRAQRALGALLRIGWVVKRQRGSHRVLSQPGSPDFVFAPMTVEEIGPRMLARIARHTGLTPRTFEESGYRRTTGMEPDGLLEVVLEADRGSPA